MDGPLEYVSHTRWTTLEKVQAVWRIALAIPPMDGGGEIWQGVQKEHCIHIPQCRHLSDYGLHESRLVCFIHGPTDMT